MVPVSQRPQICSAWYQFTAASYSSYIVGPFSIMTLDSAKTKTVGKHKHRERFYHILYNSLLKTMNSYKKLLFAPLGAARFSIMTMHFEKNFLV